MKPFLTLTAFVDSSLAVNSSADLYELDEHACHIESVDSPSNNHASIQTNEVNHHVLNPSREMYLHPGEFQPENLNGIGYGFQSSFDQHQTYETLTPYMEENSIVRTPYSPEHVQLQIHQHQLDNPYVIR